MGNFSKFFIERPIFASVVAILVTLAGVIASFSLPVSQYPEISPPTVTISTAYPGASADTIANTVAAPIEAQLSGRHGFTLSSEDLTGIEYVYHAFFTFGPAINYSSTEGVAAAGSYRPTYSDLMTATDSDGRAHGYLASEEAFAAVKTLEARNLVVPIVGDFAGPRALRAVGAWLKSRSGVVSAF